jgi:hypothetical protein
MALNKKFEDIQKLYDKLGWNNADTLKNAMGKSPDYMYIAFLSQLDTDAPVGNILYNDFISDNPIFFSYEGSGTYRMHCNLFKPGYMEVEIHDGQGSTFVDSTITATVYTGYVELKVFNFGTLSDNILQNTPIKIRVWNNASVSVLTPALPTTCLYISYVDFGAVTPTSLFFDAALTQPLFTNNIGDGALRTMMQTNGGELYGVWSDGGNAIFSGCNLYYYGTSGMNIDVYDLGGLVMTIEFNPMSAFALPCQALQCYSVTIDAFYAYLYVIDYNTPLVTSNINVLSNPPYNNQIDLTDEISAGLFFRQLYGQDAVYSLVVNPDTSYTITLNNAINWFNDSSPISLYLDDNFSGLIQYDMTPC